MKGPGCGGVTGRLGSARVVGTGRKGGSRAVLWITDRCQPFTDSLYLSMGWVQRVRGHYLWVGGAGSAPLCDGRGNITYILGKSRPIESQRGEATYERDSRRRQSERGDRVRECRPSQRGLESRSWGG